MSGTRNAPRNPDYYRTKARSGSPPVTFSGNWRRSLVDRLPKPNLSGHSGDKPQVIPFSKLR